LDAIYAIRKNARDFFEQIPAELIGFNRVCRTGQWLEQERKLINY
jgi:hypothetical protein